MAGEGRLPSENLSGKVVREPEAPWALRPSGAGSRPIYLLCSTAGVGRLAAKGRPPPCVPQSPGWVLNSQQASRDFHCTVPDFLDPQPHTPAAAASDERPQ